MKEKFGKMKAVGYLCIAFAAVLSVVVLIPSLEVDETMAEMLIKFWGAIMGLGLLFGNAGKRIGGQAVMNKAPADNVPASAPTGGR